MNFVEPTDEIGDVPLKAVLGDAVDKEGAADIKGIVVYALNEIADLQERVTKCVPFSY